MEESAQAGVDVVHFVYVGDNCPVTPSHWSLVKALY